MAERLSGLAHDLERVGLLAHGIEPLVGVVPLGDADLAGAVVEEAAGIGESLLAHVGEGVGDDLLDAALDLPRDVAAGVGDQAQPLLRVGVDDELAQRLTSLAGRRVDDQVDETADADRSGLRGDRRGKHRGEPDQRATVAGGAQGARRGTGPLRLSGGRPATVSAGHENSPSLITSRGAVQAPRLYLVR